VIFLNNSNKSGPILITFGREIMVLMLENVIAKLSADKNI